MSNYHDKALGFARVMETNYYGVATIENTDYTEVTFWNHVNSISELCIFTDTQEHGAEIAQRRAAEMETSGDVPCGLRVFVIAGGEVTEIEVTL